MKVKLLLLIVGLVFLCSQALAACSGNGKPTPTPSHGMALQRSPSETQGSSAYPALTGSLAYPYPELAAYPGSRYPAPGYPASGYSVPAYPVAAYPAGSYPEPANPTLEASATLYPAPTSPLPTQSQVIAAPTVIIPNTPTVTVAIKLVRTDLHATDPETFQLASGKIQLVKFFAFWCGTCRSLAPIVHGLEAVYGDRVNFIYLDIDDPLNYSTMRQLGYRYQPHLLLLDAQGNILQQWLGYVSGTDLEKAFLGALGQ